MAMPAPITIPTEPIGTIPKTIDLIDRIAKGNASDLLRRSTRTLRNPKEVQDRSLRPGRITAREELPLVLRGRFIAD